MQRLRQRRLHAGNAKDLHQRSQKAGLRTLADPIRARITANTRLFGDYAQPSRSRDGDRPGLQNKEQALDAGEQLQQQLELEAAIVTLDKEHGPRPRRRRRQVFPTRPRQVYDITGAGDMVLSVLGMALAAGADFDPAIRLANIAGGLEVEKIGVATVTRDEILADLRNGGARGGLARHSASKGHARDMLTMNWKLDAGSDKGWRLPTVL